MNQETIYVLVFAAGMLVGLLIFAFLAGAHRDDPDPRDELRLDFLAANRMSLDCMAEGSTWGVLSGFPRVAIAIGQSPRQAVDKAMELAEGER